MDGCCHGCYLRCDRVWVIVKLINTFVEFNRNLMMRGWSSLMQSVFAAITMYSTRSCSVLGVPNALRRAQIAIHYNVYQNKPCVPCVVVRADCYCALMATNVRRPSAMLLFLHNSRGSNAEAIRMLPHPDCQHPARRSAIGQRA